MPIQYELLCHLRVLHASSSKHLRLRAVAVKDGKTLRPALPHPRRVEVERDIARPKLAADDGRAQQAAPFRGQNVFADSTERDQRGYGRREEYRGGVGEGAKGDFAWMLKRCSVILF